MAHKVNNGQTIVDGAACKVCGPGIPGTWHMRWVDGSTQHECNNCGALRTPRKAPRSLPEAPTLDDLTRSQRRAVALLRRTYAPEHFALSLTGSGRRVLASFTPSRWFDSPASYAVGPMGKTSRFGSL